MQSGTEKTIVNSATQRYGITIPGSGGAIQTILQLMEAAGYTGGPSVVVYISENLVNSETPRPAFVAASKRINGASIVASDFTAHGAGIAAGKEYSTPTCDDAANTAVRSLTVTAIAAVATVLE